MVSPVYSLKIIQMVAARERDERAQAEAHPSDDYQRGRALATKGILVEIYKIMSGTDIAPSQKG